MDWSAMKRADVVTLGPPSNSCTTPQATALNERLAEAGWPITSPVDGISLQSRGSADPASCTASTCSTALLGGQHRSAVEHVSAECDCERCRKEVSRKTLRHQPRSCWPVSVKSLAVVPSGRRRSSGVSEHRQGAAGATPRSCNTRRNAVASGCQVASHSSRSA